jgi:hypothetical protein
VTVGGEAPVTPVSNPNSSFLTFPTNRAITVPIKVQVQNTPWLEITLPPPLQMPYLASLNIPDLTKLTNDPILHDATWPAMPTKLPSDIPKFEGKAGDDPANHVMTFHLWCSSNSIMDDSIRLRLFQCTLTGPSAKWYVEEKSGSHTTFESLAKAFLTFFQLPIRHDNDLELLSNFKQILATHIADHIDEWHRRRSLCKAETTKQQCLD